ncbi:MAG: ABC transporter permease [FCB group bacterium]|nr:ABC transporter permease [FCB group bacterium]
MIAIALKDLKIILGDRKALLLSFLLPIFLVGLFAFVYGSMGGPREEHPVKLLITDQDQTDLSAGIVARLDSLKSIRLTSMTLEEARQKVTRGDYPAVLVLHKGLADSISANRPGVLEMQYDPARELEMGLLQQAILLPLFELIGRPALQEMIFEEVQGDYPRLDPGLMKQIKNNIEKNFRSGKVSQVLENRNPIIMTPLIPVERASWALIQAVAGTAVMMLLFSVAGLGAGLLAERETGTLKRLLITPLHPMHILYGKLLSTLVVSVLQLVVVFIFAWLVFGLDLSLNPPALLLVAFTTAFACASFGIFLAAVSTSRKQVEMLSTLIILIMSAIGGSMIPLPIMPAIMQKLAAVSVNYWSIQGFFDIFWRELPLWEILPRIAILFGIGVLLITLARVFFKRNLASLV